MAENRIITTNVFEFLNRAAEIHARSEEEKFSLEMYQNMLDVGLESPIEDMFWVACHAQCAAHYQMVNPEPYRDKDGINRAGIGIYIQPQFKVGKYRVDFLISQVGVGPNDLLSPVIVELDGHDFHDKNKQQRSYEKARDRFLVKSGYRILHFTGSDVAADPFKVSHEALALVGAFDDVMDVYDPDQPLGVEL